MHNTQEEITNDMCKTHTGRIERDFYRICPSKLSKRELEDMYFALVENNMELKKTVNGQREQIKLLNTKVQRMMAQRPTNTRELKECCINNKAIINEQKEVIADLKKSNDRLTERIRLLNMRLCSAKQFLKKGQLPSSARCPKCCNGVLASVKNLSTTGLNIEPSVRSANASCQYLASETSPVRSLIPGNTTREQEVASRSPDKLCDQNKCHTVMEELKQKSIALQQELSQTHEEYASRITRLEEEMAQLTRENVRVRNESTSSERHLEEQRGEISDLLQRLRKCEAQCEHLSVQLKIEKSRSAELEMQVKAADMSSAIATAVEQHLANLNLQKIEQEKRIEPDPLSHSITDENSSMYHCQFQLIVPNNSISSQTDKGSQSSSEKIINRTSDDSGYTDTNRSDCSSEVSPTKNDKVMTKIADLHEQLKHLKQSLVENCGKSNENCIQRRKSCFGRPSCSTNNENSNNLPVPGDPDYLIRTNRLNSYKNTNDWCQDFDKSDAGSSICENNHSIVSTTKDIERSNSINEKDPKNDQEYEEGTFFHKKYVDNNADEASCINISKLDLTDINEPTEGNKTYRKEETDNNEVNKNKIVKSNDSFNFTKEKITKIDGKLISETLHEMDRKNTSTIDLKVDDSFQKHGNESNTNLTDSVSNIITKNVATTSKNIVDSKEIINRKFVSTGVDPMDFSPNEKFKDACVLADVNPLPLLEKNRLDICEQSVRVCTCPESSRRAMSTFRSCSGTLRFTTTPSNSKFRKCGCADNRLPTTPAFKDGEDIRKTTPTHGTFVLHGEAIVDRSPDTTREISSLTDLPSEKEVLSTQTSPGEDKSTGTLSDETPHTTTDYGSLSEGELPFSGRKRQSIDETPILDDRNLRRRETSTSEKMEETLRAISEELSRCRQLLQIHSSHEVYSPY